ncbi:MAG TPA: N-6 DNA methylase, partial [Ktedonobacterales bacterium]
MATEHDALRDYIHDVESIHHAGNATEHSYRPALKALLEHLSPTITAVNEPKRVACGAPDFAITRAEPSGPRSIGWVEAKDIGVSLDEVERSDQLRRYLSNLDNLILTDYLEFRWYVGGRQRLRARLARVDAGRKLARDAEGARQVGVLLTAMLGQRAPDITSADDLARRMAALAHMIRDVALDTLESEDEEVKGAREALADLREAFRSTLLPDLTSEAFADMFAQTLAYGLFAARYNHTGPRPFEWRDAAREIPRSNPFLRKLFATIEGPDLADAPYIGFVDDLARLLAGADMAAILRDFGKRTRTEDPIVHFYEPFLLAYDSKLRELRGVYYTPDPVVSYITRSVDALLARDFGVRDGLSDGRVMTLDPACGTGTFLAKVVSLIRERFMAANNAGAWAAYVRQSLLPRLFGFELLMAPYAMAHLRLGMEIAGLDLPEDERGGWHVPLGENERLGVYLTNTLEEAAVRSNLLMGKYISDEANEAARVKRDKPVMVVLGNPPYSGHSANNGVWIASLLRGEDLTNTQGEKLLERGKGKKSDNYFAVDGQPLGERNPKWLNDDYVKFIRFAQWRIENTHHGVLAFITNHGYLDNPTFRGMRQSLMRTFDEIYLLNLHGNSKKKERTPDGGKDENVFDIQQGVAIGLFVKRRTPDPQVGQTFLSASPPATVHHAHLWGDRERKYARLAEYDVESTPWTTLAPQSPFYLFVPQDANLQDEYRQGRSVTEIMPVNVLGF